MRTLQKITRNGNAAGVSIPKAILCHLEWLPGEWLVMQVLEDKSIHLRRPAVTDFPPLVAPRVQLVEAVTSPR